ncbi:hypothetical protein V8F20_012719 [Naviculisporaceae sp. PSN 640]
MATACNYWPAIEAAIKQWFAGRDQPTGPTRAALGIDKIICGICQANELSIAEFQPNKDESAVVLACGHLIGGQCMNEWAETCSRQEQPLKCPLCRAPLVARRCQLHQILCIDLDKDVPFTTVVERVQGMMDDNARNEEAAKTCQNPGCLPQRPRTAVKRGVLEDEEAWMRLDLAPFFN